MTSSWVMSLWPLLNLWNQSGTFNVGLTVGSKRPKGSCMGKISTADVSTLWITWFARNVLEERCMMCWSHFRPFFHISGLFILTHWQRVRRTYLQHSWLTVWLLDTQSKWLIPWTSNNLFEFRFAHLCFLCLDELGPFQCIDYHLISGFI